MVSDTGNSGGTQDSGTYDPGQPISVLGNLSMPSQWSVIGTDGSQPSVLGGAVSLKPWTPADNSLNFFVDPATMKTIDFGGTPAPQTSLGLNDSGAAADRSVQPPQTIQTPKQGTVIFIGGFGDGGKIGDDGIVSAYAKPFQDQNPNVDVQYFPWDQGKQVQDYVKSLPAGTDVSIVGHSYGGDTAAEVTQSLGQQNIPVNKLITIDPVGHGWNDGFMSNVANNTDRWVNVQADPSSRNRSDWVAHIGSQVGTEVKPYVDDFIVSPSHHEDFGAMMNTAPQGGQSPSDAVAQPPQQAAPDDGDD